MHSASIEAQATNDKLLELYGKHILCGLANFRVVWSEDQFEKRFGTFDVYAGDRFIRTETGIRETQKYSYLDHQWIVERLHPNYHKDVMEGNYIYECLWAFPKGLPLKWEAVDYCCKMALAMLPNEKNVPRTEAEAIYQDEEKKKQEVKEEREKLDNVSNESNLEMSLHEGDAVSLSGTGHKEQSVG